MGHIIEQQRPQANIHGKFRAILAPPGELQPGSHGTREWGSEIVLPMGNMDLVKALREENFKLLSQQFLTKITKESFCLSIHHHHQASLIDGDEGVRRNLHELA